MDMIQGKHMHCLRMTTSVISTIELVWSKKLPGFSIWVTEMLVLGFLWWVVSN